MRTEIQTIKRRTNLISVTKKSKFSSSPVLVPRYLATFIQDRDEVLTNKSAKQYRKINLFSYKFYLIYLFSNMYHQYSNMCHHWCINPPKSESRRTRTSASEINGLPRIYRSPTKTKSILGLCPNLHLYLCRLIR